MMMMTIILHNNDDSDDDGGDDSKDNGTVHDGFAVGCIGGDGDKVTTMMTVVTGTAIQW
jgi:hypothetical protein